MILVPLSKFEYRIYPIYSTDDWIEVTQEEFDGLENHTKCFNERLTAVIDYVKTREEIASEETAIHNQEIYREIDVLKGQLFDTDYKAIKYFEGELTEEEFAPIKEQRQLWRNRINELEQQIIGG